MARKHSKSAPDGWNEIDDAVRATGSAEFATADLDALVGEGQSRRIVQKLEDAVATGRETVTLTTADLD